MGLESAWGASSVQELALCQSQSGTFPSQVPTASLRLQFSPPPAGSKIQWEKIEENLLQQNEFASKPSIIRSDL